MKCDSCEGCVIIKHDGGASHPWYKYFCPLMDYREMRETILECNMHKNKDSNNT